MDEEQERRRKIIRKETFSTKTKYSGKYCRSTMVIDATALSLAKGAEGPTVGASRAYTNKECGKDKYNCGESESTDRTCT